MAWWFLLAAGMFEVAMAVSLKFADGWTKLWPSVGGIVAAIFSMTLLTIALRTMPVSTGYAVWTGIGAFGVTVVGILFFHDSASPMRLFCMALLFAGMLGLRLIEG